MKLIKWLLFAPIVLIGLGVLGTELHKAYWDSKVKALCEKEGGVTVFEVVTLTPSEYLRNKGKGGVVNVPPEKSPYANKFEFLQKRDRTSLNISNPEVWKTETLIYRKSDNSILGKYITFTRRGGDFPTGISHPSSFTCRDIEGFETGIIKKIFLIN